MRLLRLPPDVEEKEADYVLLSDIFPTRYHATVLADVRPGDSVVIWGAGPVGLMGILPFVALRPVTTPTGVSGLWAANLDRSGRRPGGGRMTAQDRRLFWTCRQGPQRPGG